MSAGPPIANRVYRERGTQVETCRLGTAARRTSASSVPDICFHYRGGPSMNPVFAGFPPEGITFLRGLKKNNKRAWFQPRKEIYDQKVKAPMLDLVTALMGRLADFAPDHVADPNTAIYRIYRDTRFSNDKTPYKTHIAAVFPRRNLEKHGGAG